MRASLVPAVLLAGCSLALSDDSDDRASSPPACSSEDLEAWAPAHFDPGALSFREGLLLTEPGTYLYDVDSQILSTPGLETVEVASVEAGPARLVALEELRLGADSVLRVQGSSGLVLAATSVIVIDGILDVSSGTDGPGAGANPAECPASEALGGGDDAGGGGGGGGGGGAADGGEGGAAGVASPGLPGPARAPPDDLIGGCPGGLGGVEPAEPRAAGGGGGGAIELASPCQVVVSGVIDAGGGGGEPGSSDGGGGGGGSGGTIRLEAPELTIEAGAIVVANGGGGGGGSDSEGVGGPGQDGLRAEDRAGGGTGGGGGGGGCGGAGAQLGGDVGGQSVNGGGGGGGAAGFILIEARDATRSLDAVVSPPPT